MLLAALGILILAASGGIMLYVITKTSGHTTSTYSGIATGVPFGGALVMMGLLIYYYSKLGNVNRNGVGVLDREEAGKNLDKHKVWETFMMVVFLACAGVSGGISVYIWNEISSESNKSNDLKDSETLVLANYCMLLGAFLVYLLLTIFYVWRKVGGYNPNYAPDYMQTRPAGRSAAQAVVNLATATDQAEVQRLSRP